MNFWTPQKWAMPNDPDLIVENGNLYPNFAFNILYRNPISLIELEAQADVHAKQIIALALARKLEHSCN